MRRLRDLAQPATLASYFGDVRKRSRAAGIDGLTPDAYADRLDQRIARVSAALIDESWHPSRLLRIRRAKPSGGFRTLAIPTVEDRIVIEMLRQALEPMVEQTLHDAAFAYRPRRSAKTAVDAVAGAIEKGATWVTVADVRDFFDTVRIRPILRRIDELNMDLALGRLLGEVLEHHALQPGRGLAQGSSLSPLLSNVALTPLDENLHGAGFDLVRYCDNLCVTASSKEHAERALERMTRETERLGLSLKPVGSRVAAAEQGFLWLGFWLATKGRRVSDGALRALASRAETAGRGIAAEQLRARLEPVVRGWAQYFDAPIPAEFPLGQHDALLRQLIAQSSPSVPALNETRDDLVVADGGMAACDMEADPWSWETPSMSDERDVASVSTADVLLCEADGLATEGEFEAAEGKWEAAQRAKEAPPAVTLPFESLEPVWEDECIDAFIGLFGAGQESFEVLTAGASGRRESAMASRSIGLADVRNHLLGRGSIAVRPRFANGSTMLGVLDIDDQAVPVSRDAEAFANRVCKVAQAWQWHVLFEKTGGRGMHLWVPLADRMNATVVHTALQSLLRAAGPLPGGVRVEVLPAPDDAPDLHGQTMTLPLGIHVETAVASRLHLPDGTEIERDLKGLWSVWPTASQQVTEVCGTFSTPIESTHAQRAEPRVGAAEPLPNWSAHGRAVERVMAGCAILRHLAEKARDTGHLVHGERLSLLYSLGHLDAPGGQAIHAIVGMCGNYDAAETSRQVANRRGLPVSCARLREKHATPKLLPHCHCDFGDVRGRGGYSTPLLHAGAFRRDWRNVLRERRDTEAALQTDENKGVRVTEETVNDTGVVVKGLPPHEWA